MKVHFNNDDSYDIDGDPEEVAKFISLKKNGNNQNGQGPRPIFLSRKFNSVLECFKQYSGGLTSPEVATLLDIPEGTASSRCCRLAQLGLITRRDGHNGYKLVENISEFTVFETGKTRG